MSGTLVTPRAGVWIETVISATTTLARWSLPVRECGLKLPLIADNVTQLQVVTPRAGVWIETVD